MEKKTPLYEKHVSHGGKIVPFGGFLLPVQYQKGIIAEHTAVRTGAGLFDVSHMGEFMISGSDALNNLNNVLTNDFTGMYDGQIRYSPMCYDSGGIVDDLLVYRYSENKYLLVVNASNTEKDYEWIQAKLFGDVTLENISDSMAQLALQGPKSLDILTKVTKDEHIPKKYYSFVERGFVSDIPCIISKTGYTGENGFEIYCENMYAEKLWDVLMAAGEAFDLTPCGLGCRDTLRLEAAMPLYGHELSQDITPLEANLSFFVKMDKKSFIGKENLQSPERVRIGLKLTDRGVAREGAMVYHRGEEVGFVTSGTSSPTLKCSIAMALVKSCVKDEGEFEIDVRGKKLKAVSTPLPFYKAQK